MALALGFALFAPPRDSSALVWPDVPERIARALASPDPQTRRSGALELRTLSLARATPLLAQALGDPDPEVRLAAADAAIRLHYAPATDAVLPWLGDRDTRLRVKACEVSRALPNLRTIPQLARALSDGEAVVRGPAAEALGAQASPDAVAPLLGKLDDPSPPVRIQVIRALARLGDGRAVVPLVGKVQDSVADVRKEVARALGDLGDGRAAQALMLQLRDNLVDVRVEAIRALGRLRAPDAVDVLAPLTVDRTPLLRQSAIAALGRIGSTDAVRTLIATLGQGDDAGASLDRTSVRDALVDAGAKAVPELVAQLATPSSPAAAISAAWVLGALHAKTEAPAIILAMRRGTVPTTAALHALAGAGTAETVTVVLEFLVDPSPAVRAEARGAAFALLDPAHPDGRAVEPLAAALKDSRLGPAEVTEIVRLLGRTGAPRAASTLSSLTSAKDDTLRLAAVESLGALGAAGADDVLLPLVSDPDAALRLRASVALARSGGPKARDGLVAKLDAVDETDRFAILTALGGILSRAPSAPALARLARELEVAAGPERDAVLEAIAQAKDPEATRLLIRVRSSNDVDDRRMVASAFAARPPDEANAPLALLLTDTDASVRAQAAWSIGTTGDLALGRTLALAVAKGADIDLAINGTAALGRIAARAKNPALAAEWLCPLVTAQHRYVRSNALSGLALAGARCGDGTAERRALEDDESEDVRASAATALGRTPKGAEDRRVLDTCAAKERAGDVARRCHEPLVAPTELLPSLAYVLNDAGSAPVPRIAYTLLLADGLLRVGTTDRRGAVFDPAAPRGPLTLRRPSASIR